MHVQSKKDRTFSYHAGTFRAVVLTQQDGRHSVVETAVGVCRLALERGVRVEQVDTGMLHDRIASKGGTRWECGKVRTNGKEGQGLIGGLEGHWVEHGLISGTLDGGLGRG